MPTISQLTATSSVQNTDQVPVYSTDNGDARKASMSVIKKYVLDDTGLIDAGTSGNVLTSDGAGWSSQPLGSFTPATLNGTNGVNSTLAATYSNRLQVEARDYGLVINSSDAAAANSTIINNLMQAISDRGGGVLILPPGKIWVSSTLDNKFSRVLVQGAGKETDPNNGVFSRAGTYLYPTNPFNGTAVLKHRTPYGPTTYANWGGGFVNMTVDGAAGAVVRLLELDSIQASTLDITLASCWGDAIAFFKCGVSNSDLAGPCDIQNGNFNITTDSFFGSQSIHSLVLSGSVNADVSLNTFNLKQYYSGSGKALWLRNQDTNYFEFINQVQGTMSGGYGIYCAAQGAEYAGSSGGGASMINFYNGNGPFYLEGLETPNATAGAYLVINHLDLGSNVPLANLFIGQNARLDWRDHRGNFNAPSAWQQVVMGPWDNEKYWAGTGFAVAKPTCTTASGSPLLTSLSAVSGASGISNGQLITGANIPNGAFVRSLTRTSFDTGTVTSFTNITNATVTVAGKSWATNAWQNYTFRVTAGTGANQALDILSNTGNVLTISGVFPTALDATSVYQIEKITSVEMSQNATGNLVGGSIAFIRDLPETKTTESLRLANFSGDTLRLWNPLLSTEWGIGLNSSTGDLVFNRIYGSGNVSFGGLALQASSGGTGLTTPGTAGNVLTSNGTGFVSQAPSVNLALTFAIAAAL